MWRASVRASTWICATTGSARASKPGTHAIHHRPGLVGMPDPEERPKLRAVALEVEHQPLVDGVLHLERGFVAHFRVGRARFLVLERLPEADVELGIDVAAGHQR